MHFPVIALLFWVLSVCEKTSASNLHIRSSCSAFNQTPSNSLPVLANIRGPHTYRVSTAIDCRNKTENCSIVYGGHVSENPTLNITTDSPDSIFRLIGHTPKANFTSITSDLGTQYADIRNGTAGWVTFTPFESCITGTLSGCVGNLSDGTVVRACTPYFYQDKIDGKYDWVELAGQISEHDLNCNPANTSAARTGGNPSDCLSEGVDNDEKSGAGGLKQIGLYPLLVSLGVVFFATRW